MTKAFLRAILLAIFFISAGSFAVAPAVHALSFKQEIDKASKAGAIKLGVLGDFIKKVPALGNLNVANVKSEKGALTGDIQMNVGELKLNWTFLLYSGGSLNNTFIGFGPKKIFKFKDMFNKPGVELLDMVRFDNQILLFSIGNTSIANNKLPANVQAILGKFYESKTYTLTISEGLTMLGTFNLGAAKPLDDAIKFLGGESAKIYTMTSLYGNVLSNLLSGKPPVPEISMRAALPTFTPVIGGKIKLPSAQFSLFGSFSLQGQSGVAPATAAPVDPNVPTPPTAKGVTLGYAGLIDFTIGKQVVNLELETAFKLTTGAPEVSVTATTFKGIPWKNAFGLKWLTIQDYKMTFGQEADTVKVGLGGKTSFGSKQFDIFASAASQAKTLGIPIPEVLSLAINDGPDKIGQLSLKDMTSIFVEMAKAASGKKNIKLPKEFPDVAIAGVAKGKGPNIKLTIKAGGAAGIDMSGALRVMGTNLATVDRALIQADKGIDIRAKTAKLQAGPIGLPNVDIQVVASIEAGASEPRIVFKGKGASLFGSKSEMELAMRPTQFKVRALQDFGSLFKYKFLATTGEPIRSFDQLKAVDFRLNSSLSSDPGKWIRTSGKKAVEKAFAGVRKDVDAATRDITKAQNEVKKLDKNIAAMRAKVKKERLGPAQKLKNAENEVKRLDGKIKNINSKISSAKRRIKKCNQSKRICVWGKPVKVGCKKKVFGECVWPKMKWKCQKHKTVANLPARGVCQAKNIKPAAEVAGLTTAKGTLIASREVAAKTLEGIRKGLTAIPVDLDPRVAALLTARHTAVGVLEAAKQTVKGFGAFAKLLTQGVNVVGKPDIFALKKSSIQGSLRGSIKGKPVVLAMNFRMLGKNYYNRFAFSMTDMKFNAKQLEVLALGAATKTVLAAGYKAKVIPHVLLDKIENIYNKKRAEVNAALDKAIGDNKVDTPDSKIAGIGSTVDGLNKARKDKRKARRAAAKKKRIAERLKRKLLRLASLRAASRLQNAELISMGKCLDVQHKAINRDGANVHLWGCHGGKNQKWWYTRNREIKVTGGKCLDVSGGKNRNGANIIIWKCHGGKNQQWRFDRFGRLVGLGGRCLDVAQRSNKNGANIHLWQCHKGKNQKWLARGSKPTKGKVSWSKLPGAAVDIGVGANGAAFVIGSDANSVWRWNAKKRNWDKFGGGLARISVGPKGRPWGVNKARQIWRHDGRKWIRMPGAAIDIGVGANGKAWVIGTNKEAGGYGIYRLDGKKWTKIKGSAVRIAVDPKGNAWVVNNKGNIFRYDGRKWVPTNGRAKDIGVGARGHIWVVGTNKVGGGYGVWQRSGNSWKAVPGGLTNLAVDSRGKVWGVNSGKQIYRMK